MSPSVIRHASDPLNFLVRAGKELSSAPDLEARLQRIATLGLEASADACVVHLVGAEFSPARVVVAKRDSSGAGAAEVVERRYAHSSRDRCSITDLVQAGPVIIPSVGREHLHALAQESDQVQLLENLHPGFAMVIPLVAQDRTIGALSFLASESTRPYGESDLAVAEGLAGLASLALERARLHGETQEQDLKGRNAGSLHHHEHNLRALVQASSEVLLLVDDHGHCLDASPRASAFTGYSHEDLIDGGLWKLTPDPNREVFQEEWRQFLLSGGRQKAFILRARDGCLTEMELLAARVAPRLHLCLFRQAPAARRDRAERTLRNPDRILESMPVGFITLDRELRYRYLNPAALELLQKTQEELLGKKVWEVFPEIQAGVSDRELRRAMDEQVSVRFVESCPPQGRWHEYRAFPGPEGLSMLVSDITHQKRAEAALRESEERFRLLVEGLKEYALFVLDAGGNIASWNAGAERLIGYSAGEIVGRHFSVFFPPEDQCSGKPGKLLELAVKAGRVHDEGWRLTKGGDRFWGDVLMTPLLDPAGGLRGFANLTRDTTVRREVELEIRNVHERLETRVQERTAQLEEALREMETFAYTIAHDLRAPLRTVSGFSELLLDEYGPQFSEGLGRLYLQQVDAGAKKMDSLIRDLLSYSQLSRTDLEHTSVELESAVWEAISGLSDQVREKNAEILVASPLPWVRADRNTLLLVLGNLISNALKFVPRDARPQVRVTAQASDGRVRIWIEDNGIGIDPEHQDRIFGIFERLNKAEEYPGTGIGLALVRRATVLMGGSCGVQSELGAGSRFWVDLPQAVPPPEGR